MKIFFPLFALFLSPPALAASAPTHPGCTQPSGQAIEINNDQVLQWKKNSANEFVRTRAHIAGNVVKILPPGKNIDVSKDSDKFHSKHVRFEIQIGPQKNDTIEVFYNGRYSPRPALKKGDKVEACGDFVADSQTGSGQAPLAILYWTHIAKLFPHAEGFLTSKGKIFGKSVASN